MQNTSSNTLLQVRIKPEDKRMIEDVAAMYGLDVRQFVVLATQYVKQVTPTLEISPAGKDFAPTLQKERCEHGGGCRVPPEASW